MKLYDAVICKTPNAPGQRITVMAESLAEAREKLEAEHGKGTVFVVYNEEDAQRPR